MTSLTTPIQLINISYIAYVRGVIELVQCLVLPQKDFKSQLFRSLAEDIVTEHVILPSVHYLTTPNYINSMVVYMV